MCQGVEPAGAAGIAGDENEVAVLRAVGAPAQVVLDLRGLVVLVGPEEADVEAVAGVFEVIRVSAEEGDVELGGEDHADVGVDLVGVEVVLAALVELHDVVAELVLVGGGLLDLGDRLAPGGLGVGVGHLGGDLGGDLLGDVLDVHDDVQLEVGGPDLLGPGTGVEAGLVVVMFWRADFLKRVGPDVVVGHDQAVGGDERAGASAVEPNGGELQVLDPGVGGLEAVLLLEPFGGEVVEDPHPLVGLGRRGRAEGRGDRKHEQTSEKLHGVGLRG